jgi:PPOX class probable F420-dependent enzyme
MTAAEARAFLEASRTAVLVTLDEDGAPAPVGMWFLVDPDGTVVMRTYAASQKAVNVRRDPRVALLVETGEHYSELRGVRLSGVVELVEDPETVADIWTGLAVKYEGLAAEHEAAFRGVALARAGKQVGLRLRPERVVSWDHRKLAP